MPAAHPASGICAQVAASQTTTPPPMGQSHSFAEAEQDGSAFRFASSRTEGGSDQFDQDNGQRRDEPTTGGGEDSRF